MYIQFLLSHSRNGSFHREASTIKPFAFLKFDVAKLWENVRENKKMTSTTRIHKKLDIRHLTNSDLYT